MPFKPLVTLVKTIRGWFRLQNTNDSPRFIRQRSCGPISTFRRLEKRRVFAVDAFFVGGALGIEITGLGQTNANLLVDGTDFFVDSNNNLAFEVGEVRGAISGLQSVHVFSNDSVGKLLWNGDFSLAPLAIPLGTGEVVRIEGLREVHLQAPLNANGNVSFNAIDSIDFNASISVHGNLTASVSPGGTILDGTNVAVLVSGDAILQSDNTIQLADESTSLWNVVGITNIESKGDIELGLVGNWDSSSIRAVGDNINVRDQNSLSIAVIHAFGNFGLNALGNVDDQPGANIDINGTASIQGTSINFANDTGDVFHVSGEATLAATTGSVSVASQGNVTLGNITASGTSVTLFEDADTTLASIQTPGVFSATSTGSITDIAGANIQAATMNLIAVGPILLADNATDVLNISGAVSLLSTSSVTIAAPGTVTLGNITASGTSVTLFEDADTTLSSIQTLGIFSATSSGSITDIAGASIQAATMNLIAVGPILLADNATDVLNISGAVSLISASSVTIAAPGTVTLGNITASGTSVTLFEDADTTLVSIQTLGVFSVTSSGSITDIAGASIQAATMNLNAVGLILLADNATDVLNIGGAVSLVSASSGTIASSGTVTLGNITASGTSVSLFEDADTTMASIQTPGVFSATSTGSITDIAGAGIQAATMNLNATGPILLADNATDVLNIGGAVSLVSASSVTIASSGTVTLGNITASGTSVTLFEDADTTLASIQTSGVFSATSTGSITDIAGAGIQAATMNLNATGPILLADNATDVLNIGGAVSLVSASAVTIASPGVVTLGNITASGTSVTLFEDADTTLASIQTPGVFSATSTGSITDIAGASIQAVTINLNAVGPILLADNAADVLNISGAVSLVSASSVTIASAGTVTLGNITSSGTSVTLFEDADTTLASIQTLGIFSATSTGSITDIPSANIQAATMNLNATGPILLADNTADVLNISGAVSLISTSTVSIANPGAVTLGNITASGTSVTLFEDADTTLAYIQTPGVFSASSTGSITDIAGASIQAATMNLNATGPILLADNTADVLNISGAVSLISTSTVSIANPGAVTLGNITASGTSVTLFEDADTTLAYIQTPGVFSATSIGSITDIAGASIQAARMNLNAVGPMLLADNATDVLNIGGAVSLASTSSVTIASSGTVTLGNITASGTSVTLFEDADTTLVSIQTLGVFLATSTSSITDVAGANIQAATMNLNATGPILLADNAADVLNISGAVSLVSTSSVTIANPGTVTLGNITASGTSVTLFEDADTTLASIQTPDVFSATSAGSITDIAGASIQAATMNLNAADSVLLADNTNDVVSIGGRTFISATNRTDIESAGSANFGSLGLAGKSAVVYEDSTTQLDGSILGSLELHARGNVSQSGMDTGAGTTVLQINGPVHVSLHGSPGNIDLFRARINSTTVTSDGQLLDNQISGVFTADGIDGDFRLRNASPLASVGLLVGSFDDLTVWHPQASIVLPNQEFNILGDLDLIAGADVNDPVPLNANPINRILNGNASISDAGSKLTVGGDAHFVAAAGVKINDAVDEILTVTTGSTSIVSLGGGPIVLGSPGTAILSELGIYSKSILDGHLGDIVVQVDSSFTLNNPSMPTPDGRQFLFIANNAAISGTGALGNTFTTQLFLGGNFEAVFNGNISLANNTGDTFRVVGFTKLTSESGSMELGQNGTLELSDVVFNASRGDIVVGGPGRTELGVIDARGIDVSIQEDTSMVIRSAIATNRISLSSDSSILNTVAFASNGAQGIFANELRVNAGTFAHLGSISVDRLTATILANGRLNDSTLFKLNAIADQNGQRYLDAVRENLPPGVAAVDNLLSGETLNELESRASFVQSFGKEYGLFVHNNKELTVEGISAIGNGIHILVETEIGSDLIVDGKVSLQFTMQDPGGVVMIAGDHLILAVAAELRIEQVTHDISTSRVIKQPNLIANAFDAARGPGGYESTRDVLYAADAFADTGTQNVLQRVSTQFGVVGESGFQTLVRYADGKSQLFDSNQELYASLQTNPSANSRPGVIPAFASSTGDAAVVERKIPFSDTFLGTFQTLPTSAVFRRSSEFFLFENAGAIDSSLVKVDLTPVVDLVDGVLSPGRKISFSMPTEIVVNPAIQVAPIRIVPGEAISYVSLSNVVEPSVLSDAKFEVFIVNVGFDDANSDGQPSDTELPSRSDVQIDAAVRKTDAIVKANGQNDLNTTRQTNLAPGEPNMSSKEIRGSAAPSAAEIERWMEEYRDDPTKPSGAYAIISVDSVTGANVLKVFGVRDFEASDPNQPADNNESVEEEESKTDDAAPKDRQGMDETSSDTHENAASDVTQFELHTMGAFAGTMLTVSNNEGNRFGRLARSLRAACRIQAENQNGQVS